MEIEDAQSIRPQGEITVGRIGQMPETARGLAQKRESEISEPPHEGHRAESPQIVEAVPLGKVRLAGQQRADEPRQMLCLHLAIAIHLHDHIRAGLERCLKARDHGTADALVFFVKENLQLGIRFAFPEKIPGFFRTTIIHRDHEIHHADDRINDADNLVAHAIARDDDGNLRTIRHERAWG